MDVVRVIIKTKIRGVDSSFAKEERQETKTGVT